MRRLVVAACLASLVAGRARAQEAPQPPDEALTPASDAAAADAAPTPAAAEVPAEDPALEALTSDATAPLDEAEMSMLGLTASHQAVDKSFQFYGFADFTSMLPIRTNVAALALGRHQVFYVGNINLYLARNLSEHFRTMAEVRFTYLPNGGLSGDSSLRVTDTVVLDYADNSRPLRWGGIVMQRIYLEWTLHPQVTVRGGQFLTPFGIWNVDHGSPAYIPVQRPYILNSASGYFPERQTGLEVLGRWGASNAVTLGYHLTLSNGGGPVAEYRDFDKNKAVGGRLYFEHQGVGYLRIGASGYYGRETVASPGTKVTTSSVTVVDTIRSQFDALSLAGDLLYKVRGFHLQFEVATAQRRYTRAGRSVQAVYFAPSTAGFPQDNLSAGGYLLLAYELPWYALTPYFEVMRSREQLPIGFAGYVNNVWHVQGGLNIHPIDEVVFKVEYVHAWFRNGGVLFPQPTDYFQLQAAWAF